MIPLDEYDIEEAFAAIEEELIKSMMRNMSRHRIEEVTEDMEWSMWQAEQLKALEKYKRANQKAFKKHFTYINNSIDTLINQARQQGSMDQEIEILEAIKNGFRSSRTLTKGVRTSAEFFRLNDRKLEALIKATKQDFQRAETAMLRMANDQYRKIIFNAHAYVNAGAGTYEKAIDMASKDFLTAGINCIEYKNGARVAMAYYARMALKTAGKRAYLTGEGEKRREWGITTVIVNKRGAACPRCLPFVGKVFIDDVWSGGKASDGDYPLLSSAIANGLYHPNCKDSHTTYFEGITTPPKKMSQTDIDQIAENYRLEQQQKYNERMVRKYKMLEEGSLDNDNQKHYKDKREEWQNRNDILISENDNILRKDSNAYSTKNLNLTGKTLEKLQKENQDYIDKYSKYRYNDSGNIIVTDDHKNDKKYKIPKELKPYAVLETTETKKGITYINRTIYDENSRMVKQIHSGNHAQPKNHPYGETGEHAHVYDWEDGKIKGKSTREMTEIERKENGDIL